MFIGYFSSTGFTPGCEKCPLGTTNSEAGMAVCHICDEGYFGRAGEPPCTACPVSYVSSEKRTGCYLCVGYEPGCSLSDSVNSGSGDNGIIPWITGSLSVMTGQIEHLDGKLRAQQSYIARYKKQRNQGSTPGETAFPPSTNPITDAISAPPTAAPTFTATPTFTTAPTVITCESCYGSQWKSCGRCCNIDDSCYIPQPGVNCAYVQPRC